MSHTFRNTLHLSKEQGCYKWSSKILIEGGSGSKAEGTVTDDESLISIFSSIGGQAEVRPAMRSFKGPRHPSPQSHWPSKMLLAKAVSLLCWAAVLSALVGFTCAEITLDNHNRPDTSPNPATEIRNGKRNFHFRSFCTKQFLSPFFFSFAVFGLWDMVIYNNQACRALNGDIGTCVSFPECYGFKGTVSGTCGRGFGFCCICTINWKKNSF